jgi:hypothetical protein
MTPAPTVSFRDYAFHAMKSAMTDARLGLTADVFRVGGLVPVGPLYEEKALVGLVDDLEGLGLRLFDDYFDLSGNWPRWLKLFAANEESA